jgi:hypothetical protein
VHSTPFSYCGEAHETRFSILQHEMNVSAIWGINFHLGSRFMRYIAVKIQVLHTINFRWEVNLCFKFCNSSCVGECTNASLQRERGAQHMMHLLWDQCWRLRIGKMGWIGKNMGSLDARPSKASCGFDHPRKLIGGGGAFSVLQFLPVLLLWLVARVSNSGHVVRVLEPS